MCRAERAAQNPPRAPIRVSKLHEDRRSYALLPETYTKPRNRFLARVRNPNPSLAAAQPGGHE
jgi:hypothetical protein